ncbi:MAG: SDR family NAD(P)-dependent oxidoreductase [Oceanococcus sp.]
MSSSETGSYRNPVLATVNGIIDLFRHKDSIGELKDSDRLDGLTCLVTGANSGLGKATAIDLAKRGGRVIMACRSGIPEAAEDIKAASGSDAISMVKLDLADFASIQACCDELKARGEKLDRVVLNAGLVPQRAIKTQQGFEMMFGVHVLGNKMFILRLLQDGTIPNRLLADTANAEDGKTPRIVFVSSESHRSGTPIELDQLGQFVDYSPMGSVAQYGHSKLVLTSVAMELSRRLQTADGVDVSVHAVCPGPINSNIAREAPRFVKPLLSMVMGVLFASPEKAAVPVVYLTAAQEREGDSGLYLHLMVKKAPAPQAADKQLASEVWNRTDRLITAHS